MPHSTLFKEWDESLAYAHVLSKEKSLRRICYFLFPGKLDLTFHAIVSIDVIFLIFVAKITEDNMHKMSNPVFWQKYEKKTKKKTLVCHLLNLAQRMVKVNTAFTWNVWNFAVNLLQKNTSLIKVRLLSLKILHHCPCYLYKDLTAYWKSYRFENYSSSSHKF